MEIYIVGTLHTHVCTKPYATFEQQIDQIAELFTRIHLSDWTGSMVTTAENTSDKTPK